MTLAQHGFILNALRSTLNRCLDSFIVNVSDFFCVNFIVVCVCVFALRGLLTYFLLEKLLNVVFT